MLDVLMGDVSHGRHSHGDLLKMVWGAAEFLREAMVEASPMVWFIQVDGFVLDARHVPVEIQAQAFDKGIIPYIPALGRDGTAALLNEIGG